MKDHMNIQVGFKNNKSYIRESFCRQPFKAANITEDKRESLLRLMLMSSSPGILNNDNYSIKIIIDENASLMLTTQGYQRLFSMGNKASQTIDVDIKKNGTLFYLPYPSVPHKASDFTSVNTIHLTTDHTLLWSEILTCGRKLSGEEFIFTRLHNLTSIFIDNKLVVRENLLMRPLQDRVHSIGNLEGYTHQSGLLFLNDTVDIKKIQEEIKEILSGMEDIIFGISLLPVNGLICRVLGNKAERLFECNNKIASVIKIFLTNKPANREAV